MSEKEIIYKIKNLRFSYEPSISILYDLDLSIEKSSLITISGPSGSGKSTLLNILGLIEPVQGGSVEFLNENFHQMSERKKNRIRRDEIGFIFQQFHLFPVLSAEENVRYFLSQQGLKKSEIKERVEDALKSVGLWEHRSKKPAELSGGQKQRVAIARAIAKRPSVIIGDEPTASLDQKTGKEILQILKNLVRDHGCTVILTTHDPMVQSFSDRNIHLVDGCIEGAF